MLPGGHGSADPGLGMNRAPERLSLAVVPVSVAGSRRTTLGASLQDLEKQRPEPARALMAGDVLARLPEVDSYGSLNLGKPACGDRMSEA
jgi:hypothetical protein